jgi:hypothetical protein
MVRRHVRALHGGRIWQGRAWRQGRVAVQVKIWWQGRAVHGGRAGQGRAW